MYARNNKTSLDNSRKFFLKHPKFLNRMQVTFWIIQTFVEAIKIFAPEQNFYYFNQTFVAITKILESLTKLFLNQLKLFWCYNTTKLLLEQPNFFNPKNTLVE